MTDEELLRLLEETPPEDLTPEQLTALRERLPHSVPLQRAFAEHLRLDQALAAVLGRPGVSAETIIQRAQRSGRRGWWYVAAAGLLFFAVASYLYFTRETPRPDVIVAPGDPTQPEQPDPQQPDPKANPGQVVQGDGHNTPGQTGPLVVAPELPEDMADDDPWAAALRAEGAPPPFAEVCFDDFPPDQSNVGVDELSRWFQPIDPGRLRLSLAGRNAFVEGLVKLRAPWTEHAALRMAIHSPQNFRMHIFSGNEGVTLWTQEYAEPGWAAYVTTRATGQPRPETYTLAATDGGLYRRLGRGTVELHYEAGTLTLTRGNVRLLTAPLPSWPTEIYLEGRAAWRGIEMFRVAGLPPAAEPYPLVRRAESPASLPWERQLPRGAKAEAQPDGSLRLTATDAQEESRVWIMRPENGLQEYVFEIENALPGSGLYLGDHQGKPLMSVGLFREQKTSQPVLDYSTSTGTRDSLSMDDRRRATPYVRGRLWVKLVPGAGTFKCFISADGLSFSPMGEKFETSVPSGCQSLGLYCLPGGDRGITLRQLQIRELDAIASLAPANLREQALALDDLPDVGNWLAEVTRHRPADVPDDAWRRACAVRTLSGRPSALLAAGLLEALATEGITQPLPVAQRLKLLDQVVLLSNTLDDNTALRMAELYQRLGLQLDREGEARPYTLVADALINAPLWGTARVPLLPELLIRREMIRLIYTGNWDWAADLAWRIKYWNRMADLNPRSIPPGRENLDRLANWMLANAAFATPDLRPLAVPLMVVDDAETELMQKRQQRRRAEGTAPPRNADWRHPFVEQVSKEGYNILAEFQAAISSNAYEDACQVITSAQPTGALGLLPESHDPQLFVSLPAAVALAMQDRPELRRTMQDKYGGIGQLRLRQAMRDGDVQTVRGVSIQFHGTHAAAEAHLWLGDRALSAGEFSSAMGHYRTALQTAPPSLEHPLSARLRLAAAMVGREAGEPPTQPVLFGGQRLTAPQFEQLVQELMRQRRPPAGAAAAEGTAPVRLPAPAKLKLEPLIDFPGTQGRDPNDAPAGVDWVARQLAGVVHGARMYFSDGFVTSAVDLTQRKQLWITELAGTPLVHAWSCVPMPPVYAGPRIYVRQVSQQGPQIVCLDSESGKQLWASRGDLHIASNPIVQQDEVYAVAVSSRNDGNLTLSLVSFDARTGELIARRPLMQLADYWQSRLPCHVAAVENRIVAVCGGCVFSCDLLAQPRWLRRQVWFSAEADPTSIRQHHLPPLVVGKQVFATGRGVRAIEALDLDTGRLLWRTPLADVKRLLGVQQGVLVAETDEGWEGLSPETGERLWQHPRRGRPLEATLTGDSGVILIAQAEPWPQGLWRPVLSWINPASGEEIAHAPLDALIAKEPRLGPITVFRNQLLAFASVDDERDPARRLYECKPAGSPCPPRPAEQPLAVWSACPADLQAVATQVMPGWSLVSSLRDHKTGLGTIGTTETPVLVTLADTVRPAQLLRRVELPPGAKASLVVEAAAVGDESWHLAIAADDETLLEATVTKDLLRRTVDLSSLAGKSFWLSAQQSYSKRGDVYGMWKKLELRITLPEKAEKE